jgi:hypothetical protein
MTPYQYATQGTALDQQIAIRDAGHLITTVRNIEMFDRGAVYGDIDRDGQTWVVRLVRPGCWGLVGPKDVLEAQVRQIEQIPLTQKDLGLAVAPWNDCIASKLR